MLRDITLGQYYQTESLIHRLDPRVKLFGSLVFMICVFMINDGITLAIMTGFLFAAVKLSRVPFSYMVRGLKSIAFLMIITAGFNMFMTEGDVLVSFGVIKITMQGLMMSLRVVLRLTYIVIGTSVLTLTTTPNKLTDGLEEGLGFMKKIGVPVHELAMMMSIALRFIPILTEEADRIMKAQAARGACFDEGRFTDRAKALIPVLVPLFVAAFKRASDLALAMEARCYSGGEGRTRMKPLVYTKPDLVAYFCILIALIAVVAVRLLPLISSLID